MWPKFEEMPPIFVNREVPEEAVPREMLNYLNRTWRKRTAGKKLLGVFESDVILLYTQLLRPRAPSHQIQSNTLRRKS